MPLFEQPYSSLDGKAKKRFKMKALMAGFAISVVLVAIILLAIFLSRKPKSISAPMIPCDFYVGPNSTQTVYTVPFSSVPEGYCAYTWATNINEPRSIISIPTGEIVVLESGTNNILCLWDDDKNGQSDENERTTIATQSGLNHAVVIENGYLYASSSSAVYRWKLNESIRTPLGSPTVVIQSVPGDGHSTRSLVFDSNGRLYVQLGSASNVDKDANHALIRRFDVSGAYPFPISWTTGVIFAIGMRNEIGIRFDKYGGLWGVENGVDKLDREPFGDIHENNPAEELNYFGTADTTPGLFYGYPYCWSVYKLEGKTPTQQFAHPDFMNDGTHTDAWCQNTANVVAPKLALPAHNAPIDILFYNGTLFSNVSSGDAFVSLHGSWNRAVPSGYKVVKVSFENGIPTSFNDFFHYNSETQDFNEEEWIHRPTGLTMNPCNGRDECLFVASDATNQIFAILPKNYE